MTERQSESKAHDRLTASCLFLLVCIVFRWSDGATRVQAGVLILRFLLRRF